FYKSIPTPPSSPGGWSLGAPRGGATRGGSRNRRVKHRVPTAGRDSPRRSRGLPSDRNVRESERLLVHVRLQIAVQPKWHVCRAGKRDLRRLPERHDVRNI